PRYLSTHEPEHRQVHGLSQICHLEWQAWVTHSEARVPSAALCSPRRSAGCHRPKIAVCDTPAYSLRRKVHATYHKRRSLKRPPHVSHALPVLREDAPLERLHSQVLFRRDKLAHCVILAWS